MDAGCDPAIALDDGYCSGKLMETGWLPRPQLRPYWRQLCDMLKPAAVRGRCNVYEPFDLFWIAIDDGFLIGAATTRLMVNGKAEIKHIAGTRAREWYPELEAKICEWATDAGASAIVSRGRRGWIPWVTKLGWNVVGEQDGQTLFEKGL